MKQFLLCWLLMTATVQVFSQSARMIKQLIKKGDNEYKAGNYFGAAELYKRALEYNQSSRVSFQYAEACRMNRNFKEAEKGYQQVWNKNKEKEPLALFWLADVQKSQGLYQKAQKNFQKYYKLFGRTNDYFSQKAKREILSCENAIYIKLQPEGVKIEHLDSTVNTAYSEFGISDVNAKYLLYTSHRPQDEKERKNYKASLYQAEIKGSGYNSGTLMDTVINSSVYHIMNPAFSSRQQALFFTLSPAEYPIRESKIYKSYLKDGKWTAPERLPDEINRPNTITTQPFIARIGNREILLFVSDRNGGIGKNDIWHCEIMEDGQFGEIYNIGLNLNTIPKEEWHYYEKTSVINTPDDEITPFYSSKDSTLYFSSRWFDGLGGFDIFKVKGDFIQWAEPENAGYPVNSSYDDLYFYIDSKRRYAYLSSNREGAFAVKSETCCNDLYRYALPVDKEEIRRNKIHILKTEAEQLIPITLYFHNDEPNPKTRDSVTEINYEQSVIGYLKMIEEYKVKFSDGLKGNDKDSAVKDIDDFFTDKVEKGYEKLSHFSNLMEELLQKNQTIVITIKGYCSPLTTTDYNELLAKRRINSLINYFREYKNGWFVPYIEKGFIRFEGVPFGETQSDEGVSDNYYDQRNSVYNPAAAKERRIQVIAVGITEK